MKRKSRTVISLLVAFSMFFPAGNGGSGAEAAASVAVRKSVDADIENANAVKGSSNTHIESTNDYIESGNVVKESINTARESTDDVIEYTDSTTCYTDAASGYTYVLFEKIVSVEEENSQSGVTMAEITGYTGPDWNLSIPVSVSGVDNYDIPVGRIGAQAFMGNSDVTSVVIPEGIETIGFRAFYGCENLKKVSIPSSVTSWDCNSSSIESEAFRNCTGLIEVTLADDLKIIGGYAFAECTALESIRLPSHLNDFYDGVFYNCTSLHGLELPEGITEIGKKAFSGCISLTEVHIPSTILSWNHTKYSNIMASDYVCAAFEDCTSLSQVTFAEGLTTLAYANLFPGCTALKSVTVPSSVRKMAHAFEGCSDLEEIILYDGLETIGEYAFHGCSALQKCRIPSTVRTIEICAFQGCISLEAIICPENMTGLGASAFSGCSNVKSLCFLTENLEYCAEILPSSNAMVYCPAGSTTWQKCLERLQQSGREEQLAALPEMEGIQVIPYDGEYDGTSHAAFSLTGIQNGDQVRCWTLAGNGTPDQLLNEIPQVTEPGIYSYQVVIQRNSSVGSPVYCSCFRITPVIQKKAPVMVFGSLKFEEQTDYTVALVQYDGESTVTYRYYSDPACQKRLSSKPKTPGTYYVVAISAESQHYLAGQTEAAELIITEFLPPPESSQQPQRSQPPEGSGKPTGSQPPEGSGKPTETQEPGSRPPEGSGKPTETQEPGGQPPAGSGKPTETQAPGGQPPEGSGKPTETQAPGSQPPEGSGNSSGTNFSEGSNGRSVDNQLPGGANGKKFQEKKLSIRKVLSPKKKTLQITWKKTAGISGYQVCIALDKKMKKGKKQITVKGASKTSLTIKKLKRKKKYYVQLRAYQTIQGKKYYSSWSKIKVKKVR